MDKGGEVTSVIENHVEGLATRKASDGLRNAPLVLLLSLALPCKDGDTSGGDAINKLVSRPQQMKKSDIRSSSVILGGEDVLYHEYQD